MGQELQILKGAPKVEVDDNVVINVEERIMKSMQFQHGGWCDGMENYLGKKGKVVKIDSDGDVVIRYNDGQRFVYNPNAVAKILSRGDIVEITEDLEKAIFLQKGHGEWITIMRNILGKVAKVEYVLQNYDVKVEVNGNTWRLNPLLCTVIKKREDSFSSSDDDSDEDMFSKMFNRAAKETMDQFFQMNFPRMREFELDSDLQGKSKLHVSVYNENEKMTELILESGADINRTDDDGDTALHIAVIRRNPKIIRLLVNKGAKVDILNKKKLAPIHIAVLAESLECVKELWNSSINVKDGDGDNPLILAVMKKEYGILDHLLTHQNIDLTQKNKKGFTAFHMAAKKGDVKSLEKIWKKKTDLVNEQKFDGFTALHITALNNEMEATKFLIQKAKAKLDIRTVNESTPLMLAAHEGNLEIVKLLVTEGADINAQDDDGNTSLHFAINQKTGPAFIFEMFMKTSRTKVPGAVDVVIFLVENGASLFIQNKRKKTPLDMITDDKLKADLQKRAKSSHHTQEEMCCMICLKTKKLVKFQPCGHMKLCVDCNKANKSIENCMQCKSVIIDRIQPEPEEKKIEYDLKSLFKIGDRVCIDMNKHLLIEEEAKENPNIKALLKKIGTVTKIGEGDQIQVMIENREYSIRPKILTKVFLIAEEVEVLKDVELVKTLQKGHGEWIEKMNEIIGKTGKVAQIESEKITVKFGTKLYYLNPMACVWLKKPEEETTNDADENYCIRCEQKTDEMTQLLCGHMHCSDCKHFGRCKFC